MGKPTACVNCYNAILSIETPEVPGAPRAFCSRHGALEWKENCKAYVAQQNKPETQIEVTAQVKKVNGETPYERLGRYFANAAAIFADTPQSPPIDVIEYIKAQANADEWSERLGEKPDSAERPAPSPVFDTITLDGNNYVCPSGVSVSASHLVKLAHALPVFDFDTHVVNLGVFPFDEIKSVYDVMQHVHRMNNVDLSHPIIINADGHIMDGWHRIMRALNDGQRFIPAKRFTELQKFG